MTKRYKITLLQPYSKIVNQCSLLLSHDLKYSSYDNPVKSIPASNEANKQVCSPPDEVNKQERKLASVHINTNMHTSPVLIPYSPPFVEWHH